MDMKNNQKGGAAGIFITLLLVFSLLGGGGFFAYKKFFSAEKTRKALSSVKMKEEIILFTHKNMPIVYRHLIALDDTIALIDKELNRFKKIGKKFPGQNAIVTAEAEALNTMKKQLTNKMSAVSNTIETIYVTWLVNRKKGLITIKEQRRNLSKTLMEADRSARKIKAVIKASQPK